MLKSVIIYHLKFVVKILQRSIFFRKVLTPPPEKMKKKEEAPYYFPGEVVVGEQGLKMSARMVFLIWLRDFGRFAKEGGGGLG